MISDLLSSKKRASSRGGCLVKCLVVALLFGALVVAGWIFLLPTIVSSTLQKRTGFDVTVGTLSVNPFTSRVVLENFVIQNPPASFGERGFFNLKALRGEVELASLNSNRVVAEEVVFDLESITIVKNAKGEYNGQLFAKRLSGEEKPAEAGQPKAEEPAPTEPAAKKEFLIKTMRLRLNKIVIVDESVAGKPRVRECVVAFEQTYENVSSLGQISGPVLTHMLTNGGQMADFAKDLGKDFLSSLKQGKDDLKTQGKSALDAIKGIFGGKK